MEQLAGDFQARGRYIRPWEVMRSDSKRRLQDRPREAADPEIKAEELEGMCPGVRRKTR